jgi:hypothetical protein
VQHALLQLALAHQQDLADRRRLRVAAEERVALAGAVDRGRLEQLPAVEDRLGVDPRGAAAGGPDRERDVRRLLLRRALDPPEHRPADDARAAPQRLHPHLRGRQPEQRRVGLAGHGGELPVAAAELGAGPRRRREQPLLDRAPQRRRGALRGDPLLHGRLLARAGRARRRRVLRRVGEHAGARDPRGAIAQHGVPVGERAEVRVRVAVAEGVAQDDVAAALA